MFKNLQFKVKNRKFHRGFTLVELLIYMGIMTIVLTVLVQIFSSLLDLRLESEASASIEQDGRFILSRMIYDIHRAQSISLPATLGSTSDTLQLLIDGTEYTYSVVDSTLVLTTLSTLAVNSYDVAVSDLSFTRLGNSTGKHTIRVTYTLTSKTERSGGSETKTVSTTVGLR